MNGYEIAFFIWLSLLTTVVSCVVVDILDITKKLKDTVTNVYSYIDDKIINKYRCREDKTVGVGKWIRTETKTRYWYACSCCHTKAPKNDYGNDYFSSYCPECGAKMELESEVDT